MESSENQQLTKTSTNGAGLSWKFQNFLKARRIGKSGKAITHVMMPCEGLYPDKYCIPSEDIEDFFNLYCDEIVAGNKVSMIEKHLKFSPIVVDFDFRYTKESKNEANLRIYTKEFVKECISVLYKIIGKYIDVETLSIDHNYCYITEKPAPTFDEKANVWKDGLHLMFPNIVTMPDIQYVIREHLIIELSPSLVALGITNNVEEVIDEAVIEKNGWMMYGSRKMGKEPYGVYGNSEFVSGAYIAHKNLDNVVPLYNDKFKKVSSANAGILTQQNDYQVTSIVRALSIRNCTIGDVADLTEEGKKLVATYNDEKNKRFVKEMKESKTSPYSICEDVEMFRYAEGLVNLLDIRRAEERNKWIEVGWCLHNIDDRLLTKWIEFSQRCEKYAAEAEIVCTEEWEKMTYRNMSIGTLVLWAKTDNPIMYAEYQKDSLSFKIKNCCDSYIPRVTLEVDPKSGKEKVKMVKENIESCTYYVVDILLHLFGHEFVCSSWEKKVWYEFKEHRWVCNGQGIDMRNAITNNLYEVFQTWSVIYANRLKKLDPTKDLLRYERQKRYVEACNFFAKKARELKARDSLLIVAAERFYWKYNLRNYQKSKDTSHTSHSMFYFEMDNLPNTFQEILDLNPYLVGMTNGVYDLKNGEFRPGLPEDYLSISTGNEYISYTWEDSIIQEVLTFVKQILPNERVRIYVLLLLASCLDGFVGGEKFHIWTGGGGNGKSKLTELFQMSFGDYATVVPVSLICNKRASSNAASPELARLKGKRYIQLNEPDQSVELQTGIVKEITGGDLIYARALHSEPITFKPQFTVVCLTNHLPNVGTTDEGTWRRNCVVNYESRFVKNPDYSVKTSKGYQKEFKRNESLNLKSWKEAFFWILTEYYKIYQHGDSNYKWESFRDEETNELKVGLPPGIHEPPEVLEHTQKYRDANDPINSFIKKAISVDQKGVVYLHDIFQVYLHYQRKINGKDSNISQIDVQEYMERSNFGKMNLETNDGWKGFKFKKLSKIDGCQDFMRPLRSTCHGTNVSQLPPETPDN